MGFYNTKYHEVNLTFPAHQDVFCFVAIKLFIVHVMQNRFVLKHKLHYVKMCDFQSNRQHDFR